MEEELCNTDLEYRPDDYLIQLAHEYSMDTKDAQPNVINTSTKQNLESK